MVMQQWWESASKPNPKKCLGAVAFMNTCKRRDWIGTRLLSGNVWFSISDYEMQEIPHGCATHYSIF